MDLTNPQHPNLPARVANIQNRMMAQPPPQSSHLQHQHQFHRTRPRPTLRINTATKADDWALGRVHGIRPIPFSVGAGDAMRGFDTLAGAGAGADAGADAGANAVSTMTTTTRSDGCSSAIAEDGAGVGIRLRQRRRQRRRGEDCGDEGNGKGKGRMRGMPEEEERGWDVDLEAGRCTSPSSSLGVGSGSSIAESAASGSGWAESRIHEEREEGEYDPFLADPTDPSARRRRRRLQRPRNTVYEDDRDRNSIVYFWNVMDALHAMLRRSEDCIVEALWAFRTTGLRLADRAVEWFVEGMIGSFDVEKKDEALAQMMMKNLEGQSEDETALLDEEDDETSLDDDDTVRDFDDMAAMTMAKSNGTSGGAVEPSWGWLGRWTVVERLYLEGMRVVDDT